MPTDFQRGYVGGAFLLLSAGVSFNAGVWQIMRRTWKDNLIKSHNNLKEQPIKQLPPPGTAIGEYTPVELTGTFDNEGSIVVGPRSKPQKEGGHQPDGEPTGGFNVLTPFEEKGTGYIVWVDRGWVPIDACKSRIQRVQYTGDGFKEATINGVVRRGEAISSYIWGDDLEANHGPTLGNAWLCRRPVEATLRYYAERFGANRVADMEAKHGVRGFSLEMHEDHSGNDQRMINGRAYPVRRTTEDMTYVALTPLVHSMYASFWFFVCGLSVYCMRRLRSDHALAAVKIHVENAVAKTDRTKGLAEQTDVMQQLSKAAKSGNVARMGLASGAKGTYVAPDVRIPAGEGAVPAAQLPKPAGNKP